MARSLWLGVKKSALFTGTPPGYRRRQRARLEPHGAAPVRKPVIVRNIKVDTLKTLHMRRLPVSAVLSGLRSFIRCHFVCLLYVRRCRCRRRIIKTS
jgi:hypothetical protein